MNTVDLFKLVHLGIPSNTPSPPEVLTPGPVQSCSLVVHTSIGDRAVGLFVTSTDFTLDVHLK